MTSIYGWLFLFAVVLVSESESIEFQFPSGFQSFGDEQIVMEFAEDSDDDLNELQTIVVNDKSKGTTWLLHLKTRKVVAVELPFSGGNHESDVSPQATTIAIPHYETAESVGVNEGGGTPGAGVSLIDINTASASVLVSEPNPFSYPKPHDAAWLSDTLLVTTAQVSNGLTVWDLSDQTATAIDLGAQCSTPHLVVVVPTAAEQNHLVATTCRCTNPGEPAECPGAVALVDITTGQSTILEAPLGAEAIAATKYGEVWVGGFRSEIVSVYGSPTPDTDAVSLDNFELLEEKTGYWKPLRMAYDDVTDTVGVATLVSTDAVVLAGLSEDTDRNFFSFDAAADDNGTRPFLRSTTLSSPQRGRINPEGLAVAAGTGYFITGGFDTATIVIVDAETLDVVASIYLPYCTLPSEMADPTFLPFLNDTAMVAALNLTGMNNWSGGYCLRTLRNKYDTRFTVLDGFNYAAVDPAWTMDEEGEGSTAAGLSDFTVAEIVSFALVGIVVLVALFVCVCCLCERRRRRVRGTQVSTKEYGRVEMGKEETPLD